MTKRRIFLIILFIVNLIFVGYYVDLLILLLRSSSISIFKFLLQDPYFYFLLAVDLVYLFFYFYFRPRKSIVVEHKRWQLVFTVTFYLNILALTITITPFLAVLFGFLGNDIDLAGTVIAGLGFLIALIFIVPTDLTVISSYLVLHKSSQQPKFFTTVIIFTICYISAFILLFFGGAIL